MGIRQSLLSITTADTKTFLSRWTAVFSVVCVYLILALGAWHLLVIDPGPPPVSIGAPSRRTTPANNRVLDQFYYFDGIGITNPSTNFAQPLAPSNTEMASKCKMFGNDCLGFDTLGSLFLARDRNIATLAGLQPRFKGGLYVATDNAHAEKICNKLKGEFNESKRQCTRIDRDAIDNYPFPDLPIVDVAGGGVQSIDQHFDYREDQ